MSSLLHELAIEAREINTSNGWGLDFDPDSNRDTLPGYLALIHSEITEAWAATSPADAAREMGDVIVRALDLGELIWPGCWKGRLIDPAAGGNTATLEHQLLTLHGRTSQALEEYRKIPDWRSYVLYTLHDLVAFAWWSTVWQSAGQNPEETVREILAKNRTRGYRHGGRRT